VSDMKARYLDDLARRTSFTRPLKLVIACGNGTAGAFAPKLFERLGCQVVPMDCTLDHTFPRYNPNPEDLVMLGALGQRVRDEGADMGLAFDGDGDRCGVVDETGAPIFSDKVGLLLARDLVTHHASAQFVVDVKSTGLYLTDPVLKEAGASTDYYKTGHSYLKQRVKALGALAGFEKSGHFFFGPPLGRGYDDGLVSGLAVCDLLEHNRDQSLGTLFKGLPHSFSSPTMSAPCADEAKYGVVEKAADALMAMMEQGTPLASQRLVEANRINGIRITAEDGTWGLIRASSNKPELVVVVESPTSRARLEAMFEALDTLLRSAPGIGPYNQTI
jgi:phosphomannomutase / phosphoglucomutase